MNYYFPQSPGELSKQGYPGGVAGPVPVPASGMPGSQHPSLAGVAAYQQQQVQPGGRLPSGLTPGLPGATPSNLHGATASPALHPAASPGASARQYAGLAAHPSFAPATSSSYPAAYSGLYQPAGLAYSQSSLPGTYPTSRPATMAALPLSSAGAPGFYSPAIMSHASSPAMYGYSGLPGPAMFGAAPAMSSYPAAQMASPLATSPGLNPAAAPTAAYPAGSLYSRPL